MDQARREARPKIQEILAADFLATSGSADVHQAFLDLIDIAGQLAGRPRLHQSMYLWTKLVFPSVMLGPLGDRSEMGHSVEGRLPMLDTELVEFVKRLPVELNLRHDREACAARSGAAVRHKAGLPAQEAPVHSTAWSP